MSRLTEQGDAHTIRPTNNSEVEALDESLAVARAAQLLPEITKLLRLVGSRLSTTVAACSVGETRTLHYLYHHPDATLGDVAAGTGVSPSTASEVVDRLVTAGLVDREVDPRDRRRIVLRLTPGAQETGDRLHAALVEMVRATLERLDPAEWPVFIRSLEVLAEELRARLPAVSGQAAEASPPSGRGEPT
jgi:DNA-binding MarR family transcriptional regulator